MFTKFSLEKSQDSAYSKTNLEIFCFIVFMEDKSEKFRTYLLSSVSLKGLEEHVLCLPNISESGANGSMLALDASGYGFESRLSECYGVYDVLVLLSMLVCGTSREGSNPSIPTIIPCQSSNGRVCKTLFHRCKSYRDVQKG